MNKRIARLAAEQGVYTGNVWSGLQYSNFIRSEHETECNGFTNPPGKLRDFDLKPYREYHPFALALAERYKNTTTILYVWRTRHATYGATITDQHNRILDRIIRRGPGFDATVRDLEAAAGLAQVRAAA